MGNPYEESQDIDISTMTVFCFDPPTTCDQEAAVIRAFFYNKLYFKFNQLVFTPYTPEQVKARKKQIKEAEKREAQIQKGATWINNTLNNKNGSCSEIDPSIIHILKSYYLFNNNFDSHVLAKSIIKKSSINSPDQLFNVFVNAGIWDKNENVNLLAMQIPTVFSQEVLEQEKKLASNLMNFFEDPLRQVLTHIPLISIDGQSSLDFDDAISLENTESG